MKVAQVLLRYDAPGGVETHVRELSRHLRSAGDDVTVYASDLYSEDGWVRRPGASRELEGIPVRRFPAVKRLIPGLTLPLLPGLVGSLDADRPGVIHAHSHRYGHVLQASWVAEAREIPFVVTTHYHPADPWEPPRKKALLRVQDHVFGMSAYRTARALIAETEREASQLREFAPSSKIRVIPPGIDLKAWALLPEPAAGAARLELAPGYVLFAGRLARNKGLPTLLDAYAGIDPAARPRLLLVGQDWGMRAELEAQAQRLGITSEVRFLGNVSDPALYRCAFAGASLLVLPSDYEAFGLVLLEAMAARRAIVATKVGGVPEAVEDGVSASLVPPRDPGQLREALLRLLADPAKARAMGEAGRLRVEERFSWERTAGLVREVYREAGGR